MNDTVQMNASSLGAFLTIKDVFKSYWLDKTEVRVLQGVDLCVQRGEWVALLGASGSGKTTLLDIAGALATPDKGSVVCNGEDYASLSSRQRAFFRNLKLGFVFQAYHMLPELSVLENVMLPGLLAGRQKITIKHLSEKLLERVGLGHRKTHRPNELSGGEQQRAAIARALVNDPNLLLADEPTGNLDSKTGEGILSIFQELHKQDKGRTILMVTHDHDVAMLADRIVELKDGQIIRTQGLEALANNPNK